MQKYKNSTKYSNLPDGMEIKNTTLHVKNKPVNPIYYGARRIEWNIFLTFQYRVDSYKKKENWNKRRKFYDNLMRDIARNVKGLTNSSIVYLGVGEYKNEHMHTHILINLKDEHLYLTKKVQNEIYQRIDKKVVEIICRGKHPLELPPNIQEVINPSGALSYILKPDWMSMNGTDKEIFHTDMHEEKPNKNRFLIRCEYFSKKTDRNILKSNTSGVNISDENFRDYRNARAAFKLHREVQCEDRAVEKEVFSMFRPEEKEINVQGFSGNDGLLH
jgi:hypothetical protein